PATATNVVSISFRSARTAPSAFTHRLPQEDVRRLAEHVLLRLAGDRLLADVDDDRHCQRRDMVEPLMDDSPLDSPQHIAEPGDVEEPGGGVRPGRLQEDVVGLVATEDVVDEVGRDGDLAAALLTAGMTLLDQAGDQRGVPEHPLEKVAV